MEVKTIFGLFLLITSFESHSCSDPAQIVQSANNYHASIDVFISPTFNGYDLDLTKKDPKETSEIQIRSGKTEASRKIINELFEGIKKLTEKKQTEFTIAIDIYFSKLTSEDPCRINIDQHGYTELNGVPYQGSSEPAKKIYQTLYQESK